MTATLLLCSLLAAPAQGKPVVAVMYFENGSKDAELDLFRKGLADMMITDLVAWDAVTVVEREKLEAVLSELKLQQTKVVDQVTAVKVGKVIGAQYLVVGSMLLGGKKLQLEAHLLRVETNEYVVAARVSGDRDSIFDLEQELVLKLLAGIDAKLENDAARKKAKAPSYDALLAYSRAIDLSDQGRLEEAQAAMKEVVSKTPTFLLARERREALLKQFQEFEKRRRDEEGGSAAELAKRAADALKANFEQLPTKEAQENYLTWRMIQSRVIARTMKRFYSIHGAHPLLVLKDKEGEALLAMRAWLTNQRAMADEVSRFEKRFATVAGGVTYLASPNTHLAPDLEVLVRDVGWKELRPSASLETRLAFILEGEVHDEPRFTIAPALGWVDAKERTAALEDLDATLAKLSEAAKTPGQRLVENQLTQLGEFKAHYLLHGGDLDGAIGAYQKILDSFPKGYRAEWIEGRIKDLLEGRSNELRDEEAWADALKHCDAMRMNVGAQSIDSRLVRGGRSAYAAMALEIEKACPMNEKNRWGFMYVYQQLARSAVMHDDCEQARTWYRKALENGYSAADFRAGAQRNTWCDLKDVEKLNMFLYSKLDEHHQLEFTEKLHSVLSYDKKTLTVSGDINNGPMQEALSIMADLQPDGTWKCRIAQWRRSKSERYESKSCTMTVSSLGDGRHSFDEGTYSAEFSLKEEWGTRITKLTDGAYRVHRE